MNTVAPKHSPRTLIRARAGMTTLLLCLCLGTALPGQREAPIGVAAKIQQLVLPGSELRVKPMTDADRPIVIRLTAVFPHGTAHRYDIEYFGLEAGDFDLSTYLERVNGANTKDLPAIEVKITTALPVGQVEPNELLSVEVGRLGGYSLFLVLGSIVWVIGLFVILFAWRKKAGGSSGAGAERSLTLADRLRPSVEAAIAGELPLEGLAELERMLLTYWRRRLGLGSMKAGEAIATLRRHEEAGALIAQLEIWLHKPGPAEDVDIASLLRPYQNLPADEEPFEAASSGEASSGKASSDQLPASASI